MTLYVGISTDHSMSMTSRTTAALKDFHATVNSFKDSSESDNQKILFTHSMCSEMYNGANTLASIGVDIKYYNSPNSYSAKGGCTRLYDSIEDIINSLKQQAKNAKDTNAIFFVEAVTDGDDNASRVSPDRLRKTIEDLTSTDRWTFVFRVPKGYRNSTASRLGISIDNIQEWELSSAGLERGSIETQSALRSFTKSVADGHITATSKFYANLDNVSVSQVKAALRDISQEVLILPVSGAEGQQIRTFVENRTGKKYKKGSAFYQLTKTESAVQDYKKIIIRDKTSNAIYEGAAARDLLNVPHTGNIKLAPGKHGNYDIFIQSTSVNRSLDKNSQLIYWENHDQVYVAPVQAVAVPVIAKAPNPAVKAVLAKVDATPAPTKTKRVRDRNTVQEKARRWVNGIAKSPITIKSLVNTVSLDTLGVDKIDLAAYRGEFEREFKKVISMADWLKCKTVGDIVSFVN